MRSLFVLGLDEWLRFVEIVKFLFKDINDPHINKNMGKPKAKGK